MVNYFYEKKYRKGQFVGPVKKNNMYYLYPDGKLGKYFV
jgi:hypothetical protein